MNNQAGSSKNDLSSLVAQAKQAAREGNCTLARKLLVKIYKLDNEFPADRELNRLKIAAAQPYFSAGCEKLKNGNFHFAAKDFLKALKIYPDPQLLFYLYEVERRMGNGSGSENLKGEIRKKINGTIVKYYNLNTGYMNQEIGLRHRFECLISVSNIAMMFGDFANAGKIKRFLLKNHRKNFPLQGKWHDEVRYPENTIWSSLASRIPADRITARVVQWR